MLSFHPHYVRRGGRRAGFTLLEAIIAGSVLTVGVLHVSLAGVRTSRLQQATASYIRAHDAARGVLENLRDGDLVTQFQAYSAAPEFDVRDQHVQVRFPAQLLDAAFGGTTPSTARFRDNDADGEVEWNAASPDPAGLLPVRITVTAPGTNFQLATVLTQR